jgi:hypothetical protein
MPKKKFTNRKVDKVPLKKGKDYMLRYIKSKTALAEDTGQDSVWDKLKDWLMVPARLVSAGAVASLVIVALVFTTNFGGWFSGEEAVNITRPSTVHASFEMSASAADDSGVASESAFILASSEDLDIEVVKDHLKVEPEIEVEVNKSKEGIYEIKPVGNLESNKVYNFTIQTAEQEFSWAYQVQDELKITGTLPGNKETYAPKDTGIEIYFSHEDFDFDQAKKNFSITPNVKGSFEKYRRAFVFVPKNELEGGEIYTVEMEAGVEFGDGEMELSEDYSFQFETDIEDRSDNDIITFRQQFYEMPIGTNVGLKAYTYTFEQSGEENFEMMIWQYDDVDSYVEALKKANEVPQWCYFSKKNVDYDTDGTKYLGEFETFADKSGYQSYVYVPGAELDAGYYLLQAGEDGPQALLQVTDVSAYSSITNTDSLVWVNDIATGKALAGAKVEISGMDESFVTDKDGIVTFPTPEEWKVDYQDREQTFMQIETNEGQALVTRVISYSNDNADDEYWLHFATDRPVYKPEDTVRFWGFAEAKEGKEEMDDLRIRLEYSWQEYVDEKAIRVNEDGSFEGRLVLNNLESGYYSLELWNGEEMLSSKSIEVESYVKPAYNLSVSSDKNAVFVGEEINYTVSTEFFDGTPAANVNLSYYSSSNDEAIRTDADGQAEVSIQAKATDCYEYSYYCYISTSKYFEVYTEDSEIADLWASTEVMVFNSKVSLDVDSVYDNGDATLDFTTNWVDLESLNNQDESDIYSGDFIGEEANNRIIEGSITETYWEKVEDGSYYDFINKKTVTQYAYVKHESELESFTVKTGNNNEGSFNFSYDEDKFYKVKVKTKDDDGRESYQTTYIYGSSSRSDEYDYFQVKILNGDEEDDANEYGWWSDNGKSFDIGDQVETALYNNDSPIETADEDRFLFMQLSNGLKNHETQESSEYSFEFGKDAVPNIYVNAVAFDGEKYEVFSMANAKYSKEMKELEVEVESDKDEYAPGDEVTLSVQVNDQDGDGVKTRVNLNMVDEAYYKIFSSNFADPLDSIYSNVGGGVLVSYDTHDNVLTSAEMDGGKGGCFTADTKILMADGSYKRIEDVKKGDKVLTKKHEYSEQLIEAEVLNTVSHFVSEYLVVNEELEITGVHTVFVNGAWDTASNLKVGDIMLSKDGYNIEVTSIEKIVAPVWVYNFEVEGLHTYFAENYYVHNDKGGDSNVRSNFKDNALFKLVETDSNGEAEVTFTLPDNVTTWRVAAAAIDTKDLQAGITTGAVKATLPFFTDLVLNSQYSFKDKPFIQMRSYGAEVQEGDDVNYVVGAETLGLDASEVIDGEVFEESYYQFEDLDLGKHDITVFSESGSYEDALAKEIDVVGSRLNQTYTELLREVDKETDFDLAEDGVTEIRLIDGGVGYYYWDLISMTHQYGDRLDQRLSEIVANELLNTYFHDERSVDDEDLVLNYQNGGLQLLPYSDQDLRLTANALLIDGVAEKFNKYALKKYLYEIYQDKESNLEDIVYSLVGLAAIDESVLLSLRALQYEEELSLQNKMYIALAFDAIGSKSEAKDIFEKEFDELLELEGNEGVVTTAMAASLAASIGEIEKSAILWELVDLIGLEAADYSVNEDILNIYEIAYIANSLPNIAANPVKFKMTKNNHTETVELDAWDYYGVIATPDDEVSISVIRGDLAAVISYEEEVTPEKFETNDDLNIERTYIVDGKETNTLQEGDLVRVSLNVTYSGNLQSPYFRVTDILPSGLTPVTSWRRNSEYNDTNYPYRIDGQEIAFYWNNFYYDKTIDYYAVVIAPGEYYADPAKVEHYQDESVANISKADTVKILSGIRELDEPKAIPEFDLPEPPELWEEFPDELVEIELIPVEL